MKKKSWTELFQQQLKKIDCLDDEDDIEIQFQKPTIVPPIKYIKTPVIRTKLDMFLNRFKYRNKNQLIDLTENKKQSKAQQIQVIPTISKNRDNYFKEQKNVLQNKNLLQSTLKDKPKSSYVQGMPFTRKYTIEAPKIINSNTQKQGIFDNKYQESDWIRFERERLVRLEKLKEDKIKAKKLKKQRIKEQEKMKIRNKQEEMGDFLSAIIGISPNKKVKLNQQEQEQECGLRNLNILDKLEQQSSSLLNDGYFETNEEKDDKNKRIRQHGLNEIVKPSNESATLAFIRLILAYQFSDQFLIPQTKKIPNIFADHLTYAKIFHYLVTNQCIADLHTRMKKIEKNTNPIIITIKSFRKNYEGMIELRLQQALESEYQNNNRNKFILKNYSLSKNRLGLITNLKKFTTINYGVPSAKNKTSFAFLCLLCTPKNKQELNSDVKVVGVFRQSELSMLLQGNKNQIYYHDFQKLSTHIRQYLAISNFNYCELSPMIYNPKILDEGHFNFIQNRSILDSVLNQLKNRFNFTQYQSIRQMVYCQHGIVLLQGPPGTGKTSTLMGLLSAQYQYLKQIQDKRKIMICAPSNAAVDHIAKRIINQGLINGEGQKIVPKILRLGIVQSQDDDIINVSLDYVCDKILMNAKKDAMQESNLTTPQIKQKIINLQKQLRKLHTQKYKTSSLTCSDYKDELLTKIQQKNQQIIKYQGMLFTFRKQKVLSKKFYYQIEKQLLNEAQIILTTLSSSGSEKLQIIHGQFACLIVDEAAQATEPNLLIALQSGVSKVLLIGDPYQLPATTMSPDSSITLFNRSLFQRFIDTGINPYFLNIQYRMCSEIRQFPSLKFYHNRLIDSDSIISRQLPQILQPYKDRNVAFIDLKYSSQKCQGNSYCNYFQALVCQKLVNKFIDNNLKIGIITPYQSQKKLIYREMIKQSSQERKKQIEQNLMINTIDSFQGQQKDIIIVSTVRSNKYKSVGFLLDERRINVTLTRSKYLLIIVGNADTMGSNQVWNQYLQWNQNNRSLYCIKQQINMDEILKQIQTGRNLSTVSRVQYDKMSRDIRKQSRTEIKSRDFLKKNKNKNHHQTTLNQQVLNQGINKVSTFSNKRQTIDIEKSHKIVQQKRKKQQEVYLFEQANNRVKQLQQNLKKGKDNNQFLKQLFM